VRCVLRVVSSDVISVGDAFNVQFSLSNCIY
jgi:hypothetical protein